jgi:putative oxidoreductase
MTWVRWAARLGLAAVMVWAAIPKLLDPGAFVSSVQNYRLVPDELAALLAALIPATELVAGLGLLLVPLQRGAAAVNALLLASFSVAMAQARMRGIDLDCGCFGAAVAAEVSWWSVARTAALTGVATWLAFPATAVAGPHATKESGAQSPSIP